MLIDGLDAPEASAREHGSFELCVLCRGFGSWRRNCHGRFRVCAAGPEGEDSGNQEGGSVDHGEHPGGLPSYTNDCGRKHHTFLHVAVRGTASSHLSWPGIAVRRTACFRTPMSQQSRLACLTSQRRGCPAQGLCPGAAFGRTRVPGMTEQRRGCPCWTIVWRPKSS